YGVAAGDFNNDGKLDLAVSEGLGLVLLLGNGDGTFQSPSTVYSSFTLGSLAVGDFNNDGKLDLAAGDRFNPDTGTVGLADIFLGNGDGTFGNPTSYLTSDNGPAQFAAADLNGDGKP